MSWQTRILQSRRDRLIAYYLLAILATVVVYTVLYDVAIEVVEGREKKWYQSLMVVVESMTTTGYGEDAAWQSLEVNVLVIAIQATGVLFLFTALPVIALPLIQEALATRAPTAIPETEDHVVICAGDAHAQALVDDLEARGVEYVVLEPDRDRAADLFEADYEVVHGDPESADALESVHAQRASWVVVEGDDEVNASIVLAAKSVAPDVPVVSVAEELDHAEYHRYAGADRVFSPRDLVGERLGQKATTTVTADLDEAVTVGNGFEIAELAIHAGSELVGKRLEDAAIRERTGANVIGAWIGGEFEVPPLSDPLDERTVLLVAGTDDQCESLNDLALSSTRRHGVGTAIVAGHGETGSAAVEQLAAADVDHLVLDEQDDPTVDVVGDATDPDALRQAGIQDARSLILTLEDDPETIFATLVARELSDDVEIIARANDRGSVRKIYRAGADYVLSLSRVTGRLLAATVLDEDVISFETQVKVLRIPAGALAGETIVESDLRARTGGTVVAIERDGEILPSPAPDERIEAGDELVVAGTDEAIAAVRDLA